MHTTRLHGFLEVTLHIMRHEVMLNGFPEVISEGQLNSHGLAVT